MALERNLRYVNNMRNVCWLAGFLRKDAQGNYYVQQNNNEEQMIPFTVPAGYQMPGEFTPVEVACHIFGRRLDDEQQCDLRAIQVVRPSVRSMPAISTWVRGKNAEGKFQPFMSSGQLDKSIMENIESEENASETDKALVDWFRAEGGRIDTRLGANSNKVFLAGFVGSCRYVEPNEHQNHGYGEVYLQQHEDAERSIPIRIYNPAARSILKHLSRGRPVAFIGQIRMKILPDDAGNVRHRSLHVRVEEAHLADRQKDFIADPPAWWSAMFRDGMAAQKQKAELASSVSGSGASDL